MHLPKEVFVNPTDPNFDVDTEQLLRQQKEVRPAPKNVGPVVIPEVKHEESRVSVNVSGEQELQPAPFTQLSSELSYVCILLPRFSDHHLVGDITESLVEWMRQICVSYGWRLDAIAVRPGYLQWVMIVPLNANPAQFMKLIRQHTSLKIFEDYPRFKRLNMSGQFWAPGNFVVAGNQLQTAEAINNFILQTRRQQGIV
jgi:REP element-mobilizing transposase RayT